MAETLIALYESSRKSGVCSACAARLDWYHTHPKQKAMPMNAGAVPRRSERVAGEVVAYFSSDDTHWSSCPDAGRFRTT
jgi:hypothetical protein